MPKAQDPMTLIYELAKALNLYTNARVELKSSFSRNFNPKFASKRVWITLVDYISLSRNFNPNFNPKCFSLGFSFALHSCISFYVCLGCF